MFVCDYYYNIGGYCQISDLVNWLFDNQTHLLTIGTNKQDILSTFFTLPTIVHSHKQQQVEVDSSAAQRRMNFDDLIDYLAKIASSFLWQPIKTTQDNNNNNDNNVDADNENKADEDNNSNNNNNNTNTTNNNSSESLFAQDSQSTLMSTEISALELQRKLDIILQVALNCNRN